MYTTMTNFRLALAMCPALTALLLTGCMVGPKYHVPPAAAQAPPVTYKESPTQFQDTDGWKVAQPQDAMLHGKWWEIYQDPELNALEERLNIDNQNIKQFFANFMEARTLVAQARSQLYPTVSVGPSYQRAKTSSNLGTSSVANPGRQSSVGSLPATVSWEPDLWGKVRNTIREEQYNAQLSAADLENEKLTEQASLATFFFEIRGQDALQAILNDTVEADKKALELTRAQYETGVGDRISVVEAENTLQNVQAQAINLGVARAQFEHAIAMLVGANASAFSIPVKAVSVSPPPVPIGLPSALLERRPDIAASERNMAAANAEIGIATAAFYPNLTLSAEGGFESSSFKHLFDWPSRFWSIGPTVSETVFDAGLRRAEVNQFVEVYNADVASYRQTVLTGFQQVEDALASVRILSQQLIQQQAAEKSAQEFVTLETARYETGIDPYVDVVTAQTTLLTDRQSVASLRVQEMTASVQLIEALGGGWDRSQLPTPAQVSQKLTKAETTIQR
ncbi:efflux transporter outer membrane subunit [Granulicella sp. S190]|uniref:efflux transporter outer membrane subunit n=1 Tax=Granulicella sp. S190 TaxID=1747226 RepID=UPI0020B12E52|nr:efflux transporter outer membrane subunit [Granulicella sp. S190]